MSGIREQLARAIARQARQKGAGCVKTCVLVAWHVQRRIKRVAGLWASSVTLARRIQEQVDAGRRDRNALRGTAYTLDRAAWAVSYLTPREVEARVAPVRLAVEAACQGKARLEHWRCIFDAINRLDVLKSMKGLMGGAAVEFMATVHVVVIALMDRMRETKTRGLTADERQTLQELLTLWAEVIGAAMHKEVACADQRADAVVRQAIAGHVAPGVRVVEAVA